MTNDEWNEWLTRHDTHGRRRVRRVRFVQRGAFESGRAGGDAMRCETQAPTLIGGRQRCVKDSGHSDRHVYPGPVKRMRKDKPTMAIYPSAGLPTVRIATGGLQAQGPLLPLGNCTDPAKCGGRCHYCLTRKYGSDYWQRGVTS